MKNVIIRNERAEDYKEVEELTRKSFTICTYPAA